MKPVGYRSRFAVLGCTALAISGCAKDPPPAPVGLKQPAAWIMEDCEPLPEVPANDGDFKVRTKHRLKIEQIHDECMQRDRAKGRWIRNVAPGK